MSSRSIFYMRCQRPEDMDAMRRRYWLFSNELCQRFEEPLAKWLGRSAETGRVLRGGGQWYCPTDLTGHSPFLSVIDNVYIVATVTRADVDRLARDLGTEVIFLLTSSFTENFQFTRSLAGTLQRHLYNKGDKGWEEVLGTPELWEAQAFPFESLDEIDEFYAADPEDDDIRGILAKLRRARRVPAAGLPDIFLDDWEIMRVVQESHGLPDYRNPRIWR